LPIWDKRVWNVVAACALVGEKPTGLDEEPT
jgi:hypothetical protein